MMILRTMFLTLVASAVVFSLGCNPRVRVRKNPGLHDSGIRYYRPKPYLLVSPAGDEVAVKKDKTTTTTSLPSDQFVSIKLEYLPDFSEEYAIDVRPGLGTANVSFKLQDGWNLTELNQELDSQFDENLTAVAELLKAGSPITPTSDPVAPGKGLGAKEVTTKWVVQATNVPIGYYEAVVGNAGRGKQLFGWRYIGFAPFNSCPTQMGGYENACCNEDPNGPIYGLAFVEGVMTFRQLNELRTTPAIPDRVEVPFGTVTYTTGSKAERKSEEEVVKETKDKINALLKEKGSDAQVTGNPVLEKVSNDTYNLIINLTNKVDEEVERGISEAAEKIADGYNVKVIVEDDVEVSPRLPELGNQAFLGYE